MKSILIDATCLSDQYASRGIGVYASHVIEGLLRKSEYNWHILGFDDLAKRFGNCVFHSLGPVRLSTITNEKFFKSVYQPIIEKVKPDLYFAPHFERGLPIGLCKVAVTIHDIIPYKTNRYSSRGFFANFAKGLFYKRNMSRAKKAHIIMTPSEFSARELVSSGFTKDRIKVIYLGVDEDFAQTGIPSERKKILESFDIDNPFILYYGGFESNKNVKVLLEAFQIASKDTLMKLVLVDKALYTNGDKIIALSSGAKKIKSFISSLSLESKIILPGQVDKTQLIAFLKEALMFVHMSTYEGFGLAVAEAMASGCAVIAAKSSCYPEIIGDGGMLVDPHDVPTLAESILRLMSDSRLRQMYEEKGIARAQAFKWDSTFQKILEVFNSVLY